MKTLLHNSKSYMFLLFFSFLMVSAGWGQGHETFDGLSLTGTSYQSGSFTGQDGIEWTFVDARGDQTLNDKAITLRNTNDAHLTSATISGGIGTLEFSYKQTFGSNVNLKVEVNEVEVAIVTSSNEQNVVKSSGVIDVDVEGDFKISFQRAGSGAQVTIDDIIWTPYGVTPPVDPIVISNVTQTPEEVTSSDTVSISADITAEAGVGAVDLYWGIDSGDLSENIGMVLVSGDTYKTVEDITDWPHGTTVYYKIYVLDEEAEELTSEEYSYTVTDPTYLELPYENELRTDNNRNDAIALGFDFDNAETTNSGNNGYIRMINGSVTTPLINFTDYEFIETSFAATTYGGVTGQELTVSISTDGGATYTDLNTYSIETGGTNYTTFTLNIDLSSYNSADGRIKYAMTGGSNSIRFRDLNIEATEPIALEITNVEQAPNATYVHSVDTVSVSADVTSGVGIAGVELYWGLDEGDLSNIIEMVHDSGDTYITESDIPAQANETTVYYQIYALDDNLEGVLTEVYSYTVSDPVPFDLPYFNALLIQEDYDAAVDDGFVFDNAEFNPVQSGGYVRIYFDGSIETPAIDFSTYEGILTYFDATTYGGVAGQELTVSISEDGGATYTDVASYDIETAGTVYGQYAQFVDLTSVNSIDGRIKYTMTGGSNSIRLRNLGLEPFSGYVYDGAWSPNDPEGSVTEDDDVIVLSGETAFTSDIEMNKLYVAPEASLEIEKVLNLKGTWLVNDGEVVFTSTATGNGELGPLSEGARVVGDITVHRYMSANRAYRMVASAVTTETSVNANWQEGVNNTSTDPNDNQNPNDGYGTHITGSLTGDNGFDATLSGNPSMFTVDLVNQEFEAVANTDENTLAAGAPYLLFVRGSRAVDLTNNEASSETILRATGKLHAGNHVQEFADMEAEQYAMFGNPFQSAIDMKEVFTYDTELINTAHYFVYDPTLGDLGAYVTVDLLDGTNELGSDANQYLQPGQAAQFITTQAGKAKMTFKESHKAPGEHTATNRSESTDKIAVQLYTTENYTTAGPVHDAFGIYFDPYFNNDITPMDAIKPLNFYENIAVDNDGTLLSIERREMPHTGDVYPLYTSGYQHSNYTFKMLMVGLEDAIIYLDDHFTGDSTLFEEGDVAYAFEVDENDPLSMTSDRFSIRVEYRLNVDAPIVLAGASMYPNPVYGDSFNIQLPNLEGEEVTITINDLLGREIQSVQDIVSGSTLEVAIGEGLNNGIYLVKISAKGESQTFKMIRR